MRARCRVLTALTGLAVIAALLAGCSGSKHGNDTSSSPATVTATAEPNGTQSVTISAGNDLRFTPSVIHAHTGTLQITLKVTGSTPHNLQFKAPAEGSIPVLSQGESRSVEVSFSKPGTYTFVCTLHESMGQTGKVIVSQ